MINTRIYVADISYLNSEVEFARCIKLLPSFRQSAIDGIRPVPSKIRSLGAWLLLKLMLREEGINDLEVVFKKGEQGKPYIDGEKKVCFNMSHSGDRVMCIISSSECGCDVESITRKSEKIAERFFHEDEKELLGKYTDTVQYQKEFGRLWTCKESYIKYTGKGMMEPLDSFSVINPPDGVNFYSYDMDEGYSYSCCVSDEMEKPEFTMINLATVEW